MIQQRRFCRETQVRALLLFICAFAHMYNARTRARAKRGDGTGYFRFGNSHDDFQNGNSGNVARQSPILMSRKFSFW